MLGAITIIAALCFVAFVAYLLTLAALDYIDDMRQSRQASKWLEERVDEHQARSELYPTRRNGRNP